MHDVLIVLSNVCREYLANPPLKSSKSSIYCKSQHTGNGFTDKGATQLIFQHKVLQIFSFQCFQPMGITSERMKRLFQ